MSFLGGLENLNGGVWPYKRPGSQRISGEQMRSHSVDHMFYISAEELVQPLNVISGLQLSSYLLATPACEHS